MHAGLLQRVPGGHAIGGLGERGSDRFVVPELRQGVAVYDLGIAGVAKITSADGCCSKMAFGIGLTP